MSVKISKAFETICSKKYNKKDMFVGIVIIIFSLFIPFINIIFYPILYTGYFALTTNNEINGKKDVFPSVSNMASIFINGFKSFCGSTLLFMLFILPIIIFACVLLIIGEFFYNSDYSTTVSPVADGVYTSVIFFDATLIYYVVIIVKYIFPATLNFYTSLQFSDFFNFKKAAEFRKNHREYKKDLLKFVFFLFAIYLISSIFVLSAAKLGGIQIHYVRNSVSLDVATNLIVGVISCFLLPNLLGQIVNSNKPLKKIRKIRSAAKSSEKI